MAVKKFVGVTILCTERTTNVDALKSSLNCCMRFFIGLYFNIF